MTTSEPFEPNLHPDRDPIPAADPGRGAPDTAPGFGAEGDEPEDDPRRTPPGEDGDRDDPPAG
ncbi:hypothetical protein B0I33_11524 [Prauserella shujinwangii]|uniref:Uncharacterized protein n=1 Tax=Prauserella shujinwangii TaxID=1453103 RepID=A0A2T0LKH3_9PSEU|nr:hypothetical protein [Prauserella shujinwangii]PRX43406.1 hypothetical protein B0I33_11524 [Prauserella shujinwangii]